jgi:hypothetical protein
LCTILSVQLMSLGILAELIARNVDADYVDKQISEIIDDSEVMGNRNRNSNGK